MQMDHPSRFNFIRSSHFPRWLLLLVAVGGLLIPPHPVLGQDKSKSKSASPSKTEKGTVKKEDSSPEDRPAVLKKEGDDTEGGKSDASSKPEVPLDPAEEKARMLERLADILSKRMQSLNDRERALLEREKALRTREESLEEREDLIESRENLARKKEKLPPPQSWNGPKAPPIGAKYAMVIDGKTMQVFHAKSPDSHTPVASTQKLLTTLIVATENNLNESVTVPKEVLQVEPTCVGIKPGQHYTYGSLIRALLVKSGNDVAACLAISNAGSIEKFAEKMNRYARDLGMKSSHFVNPHGLPAKNQYSTAEDMAILAFEVYQNPVIRDIVKTKAFDFNFSDGTKRTLSNTNRVLRNYEFCNGMKTGFTYASGNCLVSSGHKGNADRIVVVLGCFNGTVWKDSQNLLDWALNLKTESPKNTYLSETSIPYLTR